MLDVFNIRVSIDGDCASGFKLIGYYEDVELGMTDTVEFFLDRQTFEDLGGYYVDNIAEALIDEIKDRLIETKKRVRTEIEDAIQEEK